MFKAYRKYAESLYTDRCTIYSFEEVQRENHSTGFEKKTACEDMPCRLSFSSITNANQTENANKLMQTVKLFISPDIEVKQGSRIDVTRNGIIKKYKCSGETAVYSTHQEIVLVLAEEEA